jgi:hypothetical protein
MTTPTRAPARTNVRRVDAPNLTQRRARLPGRGSGGAPSRPPRREPPPPSLPAPNSPDSGHRRSKQGGERAQRPRGRRSRRRCGRLRRRGRRRGKAGISCAPGAVRGRARDVVHTRRHRQRDQDRQHCSNQADGHRARWMEMSCVHQITSANALTPSSRAPGPQRQPPRVPFSPRLGARARAVPVWLRHAASPARGSRSAARARR